MSDYNRVSKCVSATRAISGTGGTNLRSHFFEYAESEFRTLEFVICKFNVIYMNIK